MKSDTKTFYSTRIRLNPKSKTCYLMQESFIQCGNVLINAKFVLSNVKGCYPMQEMCYTTFRCVFLANYAVPHPLKKANYAARCGKFLQNVRPLCGDFMQTVWQMATISKFPNYLKISQLSQNVTTISKFPISLF